MATAKVMSKNFVQVSTNYDTIDNLTDILMTNDECEDTIDTGQHRVTNDLIEVANCLLTLIVDGRMLVAFNNLQYNENNKLLNQEINNLENGSLISKIFLKNQLNQVNLILNFFIEITQLHSQKVDLKKLMEDLTREYLMNKQQAKKHNDFKNSKYFKQ